jgi:hypothetical protein
MPGRRGGSAAPIIATKRLGATIIEVRRVGELSEHELRMLELEENLHRQELTPPERSKTMAELAEVTAAHLREEAEKAPDPPQRTAPSNDTPALEPQGEEAPRVPDNHDPGDNPDGRPDTQRKVAEAMGVSQSVLSLAERHVEVLKCYPELGAPDVFPGAGLTGSGVSRTSQCPHPWRRGADTPRRGLRHVHQNRPLDHLHRVARDPAIRLMHRVARGDVIPPAVGATPDHVAAEFSRP